MIWKQTHWLNLWKRLMVFYHNIIYWCSSWSSRLLVVKASAAVLLVSVSVWSNSVCWLTLLACDGDELFSWRRETVDPWSVYCSFGLGVILEGTVHPCWKIRDVAGLQDQLADWWRKQTKWKSLAQVPIIHLLVFKIHSTRHLLLHIAVCLLALHILYRSSTSMKKRQIHSAVHAVSALIHTPGLQPWWRRCCWAGPWAPHTDPLWRWISAARRLSHSDHGENNWGQRGINLHVNRRIALHIDIRAAYGLNIDFLHRDFTNILQ